VRSRPLVLTRVFHTTVARRITLLLLGCALVPLGALAWLTLRRTTHELDVQAREHLHHDVKAAAINGVERLAIQSDKLRLLGEAILSGRAAPFVVRDLFGDSSIALAFEAAGGAFQPLRGAVTRPMLTLEQATHLARTGTLIITEQRPGSAPRHVLLVRTAVERRTGVAFSAIDQRALWDLDDDLLPPSSALCVFDGHTALVCSSGVTPRVITAIAALPSNSAGTVTDDQGTALVQTWTVPLGYAYGAEPWVLAITRAQATVRAPLERFVRDFWLVVLLSLLVVTLVSVGQVRRSLRPLDQLMTATERLARRDFDTWIDVKTGDEFQDLGDAINALAADLKRQFDALEAFNLGTLAALARAIDAKSPWTAGHSERVTAIAVALGREMHFPAEQLADLHRGGLVHDIGKLATPSDILDKPGPLTPDERRIIEEHPACGARILKPIAAYARLLPIVSQHHERWDGAGYPCGLSGDDIALSARVVAVADTLDAITSARPYRAGLPVADAIAIIVAQAGRQFDPDVVAAFTRLMASRIEPAPDVHREHSEHSNIPSRLWSERDARHDRHASTAQR
jgi:putative nucleotidyltransferase with HDIG domain